MCGIVGAVAHHSVQAILMQGLQRLAYRGYDSAGIATINEQHELKRVRRVGKVDVLAQALVAQPLTGNIGIAHTRWATHGIPNETNAHPHFSHDRLAIVHNGIIENYQILRQQLIKDGFTFISDTDTEVIAHLLQQAIERDGLDLFAAMQKILPSLEGAYALAVIQRDEPHRLVGARLGSPLVVGLTKKDYFLASDPLALVAETNRFIYLEDGDLVDLTLDQPIQIINHSKKIKRDEQIFKHNEATISKGHYRHFMLKEIFEQPTVVAATLEGRLSGNHVLPNIFGQKAEQIFPQVKALHIVACGTSYHAGLVARYWLESLLNIPVNVEVASEYRYRHVSVMPGTLLVSLSQSGETADTLAVVRNAKASNRYLAQLAICNVASSSLMREADLSLLTLAGPEIGVASTKAFITQLTALLLLTLTLRRIFHLQDTLDQQIVQQMRHLPNLLTKTLMLDQTIQQLAFSLADKQHALFLGRGMEYPIAMEGALKLKEISYIHAEAYPAGELKHGPLALVNSEMPVIAIAPNNQLAQKLQSNLQEVYSRGGQLIIFADEQNQINPQPNVTIITVPTVLSWLAPLIYTVPLQLLAYHVAVLRDTDIDQPRNLAKSVTVE